MAGTAKPQAQHDRLGFSKNSWWEFVAWRARAQIMTDIVSGPDVSPSQRPAL
jgi:hypothetical protein